jgi:hypothetical protein
VVEWSGRKEGVEERWVMLQFMKSTCIILHLHALACINLHIYIGAHGCHVMHADMHIICINCMSRCINVH